MKLTDFIKTFGGSLRCSTLCYLVRDNHILLAQKKRGFGVGKINGVGGKVNVDESIEDAAKREAGEEIGIKVDSLEKVAILDFYFDQNSDWNQSVFVFFVKSWKGDPVESEEMRPSWYFDFEIPYGEMWPADIFWLPTVLKNKKVKASFLLDFKGNVLEKVITIKKHI